MFPHRTLVATSEELLLTVPSTLGSPIVPLMSLLELRSAEVTSTLPAGMHHASWDKGEGWCAYSDITMAIQQIRAASRGVVDSVWVIDTDAHQGNGYARDKLRAQDARTTIIDLYNSGTGPQRNRQALYIRMHARLTFSV